MEGVISSGGGVRSMPSSRLAKDAKDGLRQVPLGDLWLGDLSVALPEPVPPSTNMIWIQRALSVPSTSTYGSVQLVLQSQW